jgi:hypothetical protein
LIREQERLRALDVVREVLSRTSIPDNIFCRVADTVTRPSDYSVELLTVYGHQYRWVVEYSPSGRFGIPSGVLHLNAQAACTGSAWGDPPNHVISLDKYSSYSQKLDGTDGELSVEVVRAVLRLVFLLEEDESRIYAPPWTVEGTDVTFHGANGTGAGWGAVSPPPRRGGSCLCGVLHPHHFDVFGGCRCSLDALMHLPLLRLWGVA